METNKISNYVTVSRQVASDYRSGKITALERDVLLWLRTNANPYGVTVTSMDDLLHDMRGIKDKSSINKALLTLKRQRYIYYNPRKGRRGTFEIHHGDWIRPDGTIKQLDSYFTPQADRGSDSPINSDQSEVAPEVESNNQRSEELKSGLKELADAFSINAPFRTSDNDKENETDTDINRYIEEKKSVKNFLPRSYEEEQCRNIAQDIGEQDMAFLLGTLRKHGMGVIEHAYSVYKQKDLSAVEDKARYLNGIVQNLISR